MRKSLLFSLLFISTLGFAQSPQKFSYQTVIRNSSNQLLANQQVGIKISVLQGSETGIVVFSERHTPTTNSNGLATLSIGSGSVLNGNFQNINWASGSYFIQTETDPNGGNNYTITSTQQLLSVPYALYAETSGSSTPGPQGPIGQTGPQGPQGNPASDDQQLSVSEIGDTLYLQRGGFVIVPGLSLENIFDSVLSIQGEGLIFDNFSYNTIILGNGQEWMVENLRTSKYRNGDSIFHISDNTQWAALNAGAWCFFDNDSAYNSIYGKLYNWYAVTDSRRICPTGWHIPIDADWTKLTIFLGDEALAGGKLKSSGLQNWLSPNLNSTNETGFSGLPGAFRQSNGSFASGIGGSGYWWSSSVDGNSSAWSRFLSCNDGYVYRSSNQRKWGLSVRCLRD
jgi:uncharacterized protein (TIGR02145 family)